MGHTRDRAPGVEPGQAPGGWPVTRARRERVFRLSTLSARYAGDTAVTGESLIVKEELPRDRSVIARSEHPAEIRVLGDIGFADAGGELPSGLRTGR